VLNNNSSKFGKEYRILPSKKIVKNYLTLQKEQKAKLIINTISNEISIESKGNTESELVDYNYVLVDNEIKEKIEKLQENYCEEDWNLVEKVE